jgi:hypothetical protein
MAANIASVANHPNRSRQPGAKREPRAADVIAAREVAKETQSDAAARIRGTLRSWQAYEDSGANGRRMHPGLFELYLIKTGQPIPDWLA